MTKTVAVICVPTGWTVLAVPCVATTKQNGTSSYWSLTCTPTYTLTHSYIHAHTLIHTRSHTHTYTLTHIHTRTHSYIHAHTLIHTRSHTHTYTLTHSYIHAHTLIHTRSHTHTYTLTHSYIHAHTHTLFKIQRHTGLQHSDTDKIPCVFSETLCIQHFPCVFGVFLVGFFLPQNIIFILLPLLLERYTISYSTQWSRVSFLFTRGNSLKTSVPQP